MLRDRAHKAIPFLLEFIFPSKCVLCNEGKSTICARCASILPKARLKCLKCGNHNPYGIYCPNCVGKFKPDQVLSVFDYCNEVKKVIHEFKYKDYSFLSDELARLMLPVISGIKSLDRYVLSPIPINRKKLLYRGYNQSELLANSLGKIMRLPVENILSRNLDARPNQAQLAKSERCKNIKGAFFIKGPAKIPERIILIDDVITSGATVEEATKVLKKGGAKKVVCVSLALG